MLYKKIIVNTNPAQTATVGGLCFGAPAPGGIRGTIGGIQIGKRPAEAMFLYNLPKRPARIDGNPVDIIALGDDSPVGVVDIYFGGRTGQDNVYRIAPGCPFIGELKDDTIGIVPVHCFSIPTLGTCDTAVWGAGLGEQGDDTTHWPYVSLNLWRGNMESIPNVMYQRAPLEAQYAGGSLTGRSAMLVASVDERKSWDAIIQVKGYAGGTTSVECKILAIDYGYDSTGPVAINTQTIADQSFASPGGTLAYEFQGRPYQVLALQCIPTGGGTFQFTQRITASDNP